MNLGANYNQVYLAEIIEKTQVHDGILIKEVLNEMIENTEIYAKFSEENKLVLFDLETNIEEIDNLMETFKKWEQKGYEKKIN